jgi:hypothetical protein
MSTKGISLIQIAGRFTLLMAGIFLLLFLANIRSRFYYHGPNYSFLFWMFLYCALAGFGLIRLKRWAILLLFLPGICAGLIFIYASLAKGAHVPMPWALLNYGFVAVLLGVPALMLRYWDELH